MSEPHAGHRSRLKTRAFEEGLRAFQPHEVLELLLFYVLPRHDVNELAHCLIDRFGSVSAVLSASPEALMQINGIGTRAAAWLSELSQGIDAYRDLRLCDRPCLGTRTDTQRYLTDFFANTHENECWLFCLNSSGYVLHQSCISGGANWATPAAIDHALKQALIYHAYHVLLVNFRRLEGKLSPSAYDIARTNMLANMLERLSIRLLDHLMISGHTSLSLRASAAYTPIVRETLRDNLLIDWLDS